MGNERKKETDLSKRLYEFALKIVMLVRKLPKELAAKETNFWLRLLRDSKIVKEEEVKWLIDESVEVRNILGTGVKTAKRKNKR